MKIPNGMERRAKFAKKIQNDMRVDFSKWVAKLKEEDIPDDAALITIQSSGALMQFVSTRIASHHRKFLEAMVAHIDKMTGRDEYEAVKKEAIKRVKERDMIGTTALQRCFLEIANEQELDMEGLWPHIREWSTTPEVVEATI